MFHSAEAIIPTEKEGEVEEELVGMIPGFLTPACYLWLPLSYTSTPTQKPSVSIERDDFWEGPGYSWGTPCEFTAILLDSLCSEG